MTYSERRETCAQAEELELMGRQERAGMVHQSEGSKPTETVGAAVRGGLGRGA